MPIYAYKCSQCGHADDVLQKMSADPLTVCPACGASSYTKQVTAAGFALKGSGWYVTDFRGGNQAGGEKAKADPAGEAKPGADTKAADPTGAPAPKSEASTATTPAANTPVPVMKPTSPTPSASASE